MTNNSCSCPTLHAGTKFCKLSKFYVRANKRWNDWQDANSHITRVFVKIRSSLHDRIIERDECITPYWCSRTRCTKRTPGPMQIADWSSIWSSNHPNLVALDSSRRGRADHRTRSSTGPQITKLKFKPEAGARYCSSPP